MDENQALRIMAERLAARVPGVSPPSDDAPPRLVPAAVPDDVCPGGTGMSRQS